MDYKFDENTPLPTIFAALDRRRAMNSVTSKESLDKALTELEGSRMDIVTRWSSPDDFAKVYNVMKTMICYDKGL